MDTESTRSGQFGPYDGILPVLEKRQKMFMEVFGGSPPLPNPPPEGRAGILPLLRAAGARTILPDMRGFGASGKPRETAAYADSAMARDVIALIAHRHLESVDVIGFSMGAGNAARLLTLGATPVNSTILGGIGDYAIEDTILEFPKDWPIPDYIPRPLTMKVWTEEGARILDQGEIVLGHLGSAHIIAAQVKGADTKVLAVVIRGAVAPTLPVNALNEINVPVPIVNGKADLANQKVVGFLKGISTARFAQCEGDHLSTPFQPTFHRAVVEFFREQWRLRAASPR